MGRVASVSLVVGLLLVTGVGCGGTKPSNGGSGGGNAGTGGEGAAPVYARRVRGRAWRK